MLIDFCCADLVTNISSSVCECEGFSVNNLISKVELERNKGFLVDYFIKPPITIEFQFICEIQLSHVILWSRVGAQKTTGVELLTRISDECVYNSIGSAFMKSDLVGFLFYKHGEKPTKQVDSHNFLERSFKSLKFLRTRNLEIKIFKTLGSSVPALQRVEIWGEVCRDCPKRTLHMVMKAWAGVKNAKAARFINTKKHVSTIKDEIVLTSVHGSEVDSSQCQIPDEFLDPISCEIMATPMIMPSGKVIDNSTLERFIKEEATWGRFPSDPFTGKLFTKISRPKMSVPLKTRIDKYLLDNCDKLYCKTLPRTVGDGRATNVPLTSSLLSNNKAMGNEQLTFPRKPEILKLTYNQSSCSLKTNDYRPYDKKRKLVGIEDYTDLVVKDMRSNESISNSNKLQDYSSTVTSQNTIVSLKKYDEMKEKSLECLLKTTLSSLPSFTKNTVSDNYQFLCFKCNSDSVLYELPCKHHVCRLCLSAVIEANTCKCMVCSTNFKTSDPKRVHLVNEKL